MKSQGEALTRKGIIIFDFNSYTNMNHLVSFSLFLTLESGQWVKNNLDLYLQLRDETLITNR